MAKHTVQIVVGVLIYFCLACENENAPEIELPPVNFFSMSVNGGEWIPRQRSTTCEDVFYSLPGWFSGPQGYRPFYDVFAFGKTNGYEAQLVMQITDVVTEGTYVLNNSYRKYHHYASLIIYEGSLRKIYVSKPDRVPFIFNVNAFLA